MDACRFSGAWSFRGGGGGREGENASAPELDESGSATAAREKELVDGIPFCWVASDVWEMEWRDGARDGSRESLECGS
jgi:hypothetical protein